jgi:hypothetical protein
VAQTQVRAKGSGLRVVDAVVYSIDLDDEESCHDPSTTRPGAPKCGAKKKPGRFGRDDSVVAAVSERLVEA